MGFTLPESLVPHHIAAPIATARYTAPLVSTFSAPETAGLQGGECVRGYCQDPTGC